MRARNLKPGFFKNEILASLSPLARILYEGLWCLADREGRLEDRPGRIKAEVLPYDECDIDALLESLVDKKFIIRYKSKGEDYLWIPTFSQHQNPHHREPESKIPAYNGKSKPRTSPRPAQGQPRAKPLPSRADSGFLNPDSGFLTADSSASTAPDHELLDELLDIAANVRSLKGAWEPSRADRNTMAALVDTFPPEQLRTELAKFRAYAAQREYTAFGRAFASWMGRVKPEPKTMPRPKARDVRIRRARDQLRATGDEDVARAMVLDDLEWQEVRGL